MTRNYLLNILHGAKLWSKLIRQTLCMKQFLFVRKDSCKKCQQLILPNFDSYRQYANYES